MGGLPNLLEERRLWRKGYFVIGIDEVGRGAFAGPLVVGGVIFPPTTNYPSTSFTLSEVEVLRASERIKYLESLGINDSKKLSPNTRRLLSKIIQNESLAYHISSISVAKINRFGIGKATFMAMRDVVKNLRENLELGVKPLQGFDPRANGKIFVLIDGFYVKYIKNIGLKNQKGIVGGDEISLSIAAASIIAKVARDCHMKKLSAKYKEYGWGRNKGYGTHFHRDAIAKFGPTPLHRKEFIKDIYSVDR